MDDPDALSSYVLQENKIGGIIHSYPLLKYVSIFFSKNTYNWMLVLKMSSCPRIAFVNMRNCSHCQDVLHSYFWAYFGSSYFNNTYCTEGKLCLGKD